MPGRHDVPVAGVDVAGDACRLVVIDKIPFPRPDDPVSRARSMDVERGGGNGFVSVSLTHAALMMAQGVGRCCARPMTGASWRSSIRAW